MNAQPSTQRKLALALAAFLLVLACVIGAFSFNSNSSERSADRAKETPTSTTSTTRSYQEEVEDTRRKNDALDKERWAEYPEPELRVSGLVPMEIAEEMNGYTEHERLAQEGVAYELHQVQGAEFHTRTDLNNYDFVITTSHEQTEMLLAADPSRTSVALGETPLVYVTSAGIAESMAEKGIINQEEENYTFHAMSFARWLNERPHWDAIDPRLSSQEEVTLDVADPSMSIGGRLAAKQWNESIRTELSYTRDMMAVTAANDLEVAPLNFNTGKTDAELLSLVESISSRSPAIVAVTERQLLEHAYTQSFSDASKAFLYPDKTPAAEISVVALNEKGNGMISHMEDSVAPPFHYPARSLGYRMPGEYINDSSVARRLGKPLKPEYRRSAFGTPNGVTQFMSRVIENLTGKPPVTRDTPRPLERPKYAK